jgi:hypothetical protein
VSRIARASGNQHSRDGARGGYPDEPGDGGGTDGAAPAGARHGPAAAGAEGGVPARRAVEVRRGAAALARRLQDQVGGRADPRPRAHAAARRSRCCARYVGFGVGLVCVFVWAVGRGRGGFKGLRSKTAGRARAPVFGWLVSASRLAAAWCGPCWWGRNEPKLQRVRAGGPGKLQAAEGVPSGGPVPVR